MPALRLSYSEQPQTCLQLLGWLHLHNWAMRGSDTASPLCAPVYKVAEAKDAELARVLESNAGLREEVSTLRAMQVSWPLTY